MNTEHETVGDVESLADSLATAHTQWGAKSSETRGSLYAHMARSVFERIERAHAAGAGRVPEWCGPAIPSARKWAAVNGLAVTQEWMDGWEKCRQISRADNAAPRALWRQEWQGSGPQRGWHMRVMDGGNYGSIFAYLGEKISGDSVQALVSHHNSAMLSAAPDPKPAPEAEAEAREDRRYCVSLPFDLIAELRRLDRIASAIGASKDIGDSYDDAARGLVCRLRSGAASHPSPEPPPAEPETRDERIARVRAGLRDQASRLRDPIELAQEIHGTAPPAGSVEVTEATRDAIDNILSRLNGWGKAYPESVFREITDEDREWLHATRPGLMDRIAAGMGRHMHKMIAQDLAALTAALQESGDD